ncbi:MAG: LPS-assembly protein LptD, partial [Planctomycetes bacterium]|nr:LPS-assembly protein LptD [Planctomycetota bacterium]
MSTRERHSRGPARLGLAGLTAAMLSAGLAQAEDQFTFVAPDPHLEQGLGPNAPVSVVVARQGFVLSYQDKRLLGDAIRWDQSGDDVYAEGHIVYLMPHVRIHADRIGLHPNARTGKAWKVEAFIEAHGQTLHARADRIEVEPTRITLHDVEADFGYGGVGSIWCPKLHVYLFEKPKKDRAGFEEYVSGVDVVSPTGRIIGVPFLWFPYLYRDFTFDYPWSRILVGRSRRLGYFAHYWIGSNLPVFAGWHTRLEARGDTNTRAGEGFGANAYWRHDRFGRGSFQYFEMPKENVAGGPNDTIDVAHRRARLFDAEHTVNLGSGAFYGRYTAEPPQDPLAPGSIAPIGGGDERFRADYLRPDLDRRPFARKGAGIAYGTALGTLVVDTQHNPQRDLLATERWLGVHAEIPPANLVGPVHIGGSAWVENLHRPRIGTEADRTRVEASIGGLQWLGGLGLDATGGVRGLRYDGGRIASIEQRDPPQRHVGYGEAGMRVRFENEAASYTHVFTPRLGIEATTVGRGDILPAYGFGDRRDILEEDQHFYVAGFETAYTHGPHLLRARVKSRWAVRDEDRRFVDPVTGVVSQGPTRFADVSGEMEGEATSRLSLSASFLYDARPRRWQSFTGLANYIVSRHVILHHVVNLSPDTSAGDRFDNEPGFSLLAERYRFDGSVTLRPGGRPVDIYFAQVARTMVDGRLTFSYEYQHSPAGGFYDQRFSV